ncbi:hypothetical protein [Streptomyces sp. NBC_01803]|uniref:hypothetical protein n=1 Tax=Streptomyces sp. NBC_01803 TaxID=2975946 RepID=UPI002DD8561F|nr:hypothetical protein [Streptomyces sp. NBC_01803]WSA43190.1 hypothetical protein OIE51_02645 [Streptomyces sp. NBC_01803]
MSQSTQRAQQEMSATAGQAGQAARGLAGDAREQARSVTGQARDHARTTAHDLRGRVADEAGSQARRTVGAVRQWADDLAGLADNAPADSPARGMVAQAADRGHRAADYLDERGIDGLIEDVQGFARQRPAAFLGGAALAGFAIGRLVKIGRADSTGQDPSAGTGTEPREV